MGLKCLASVLWFSQCLSIAFSVSREFPGNGYLKYDIVGKAANKQINSNKSDLRVQFRTFQPTGLLFHTQTSGGKLGDYLTLELCGGRICVGMKLGGRNGDDDKKTEILGRDLSNGQVHKVLVKHNNFITTIVLNEGTSDEERREIKTLYKKLEVDIAIYVGGAPSFQNLQGVKSNTPFMGCLTDVEFKPEGMTEPIKFLVKGVTDPVNVDMNNECPSASSFEPYTFDGPDSSFTFQVKKNAVMTGSFKFRSYKKIGTLLKQVNGDNGFTISYRERFIGLNVKIGNTETDVSVTFSASEQKANSGNWHTIEYSIGTSSFSLTVDNKTPSTKAPPVAFPADFFGTQAIAGGFTGCMRDLKINNEEKKPLKGASAIKNVETDSCNITDLCIFSPCLNKGSCSQDGRTFTCDCTTSGYQAPICQFPEASQNCEELKKRLKGNAKDGNWTLDLDGPGPLKADSGFYCNMTADPPITVVYSEDKGVKVITDNNGGTIAQPYVADIRYYPSLDFAKSLAMNSANCKQFIEFGCKNAKLFNAGEKDRLANWISAGGVYQDYWGGAPPNSESCACGVNNTCLPDKKKKCNCDARSNIWTKDEGFLTATADLPVTQVVFRDVNPLKGSEANFTVGNLYCSGNISNTATFVNEDGMITLDKWTPPSHGVISLFLRTPYPGGIILFNGFKSKEFFKLYIINETSVGLEYNIGNGYERVELRLKGSKQVNDRQWHEVVMYRNMKQFGLKLDTEEGLNLNPLFLERDLDLEDNLHVGGDPSDVREGFVGCIRGLTINGEVIDLNKKAGSADHVQGGCGAAFKDIQYNPVVVELPLQVIISVGELAFLMCEVSGDPEPSVTWTKNGNSTIPRAQFKNDGRNLVIQDVSPQDSGVYECKAFNRFEENRTSTTVIVGVPPSIIEDVSPSSVICEMETLCSLSCHATSISPFNYSWTKNGQVQVGDNSKIMNNIIVLTPRDAEDYGVYVCHATNSFGSTAYKITVSECQEHLPNIFQASTVALSSLVFVLLIVIGVLVCRLRRALTNNKTSTADKNITDGFGQARSSRAQHVSEPGAYMELDASPSEGQSREPAEYQTLEGRHQTSGYYNVGIESGNRKKEDNEV